MPDATTPSGPSGSDFQQLADTLWKSADTLRGRVDAAAYKHIVPGGMVPD